jgi:hypothetical protein
LFYWFGLLAYFFFEFVCEYQAKEILASMGKGHCPKLLSVSLCYIILNGKNLIFLFIKQYSIINCREHPHPQQQQQQQQQQHNCNHTLDIQK